MDTRASIAAAHVMQQPPPFSGEGEDLHQYCLRFNTLINALDLDNVWAYKILPSMLTGRALRAYEALTEEDAAVDYQSLLDALYRRLNTRTAQNIARLRVNTSIMPSESISQFGTRVQSLVRQAFPSLDDTTREIIAADKFIFGLPSHIMKKLIRSDFTSLTHAIETAKAEHAFHLPAKDTEKNKKVKHLISQLSEIDIDNLTQALNQIAEKKDSTVNYVERPDEDIRHSWNNDRYSSMTTPRRTRSLNDIDDRHSSFDYFDEDERRSWTSNDEENTRREDSCESGRVDYDDREDCEGEYNYTDEEEYDHQETSDTDSPTRRGYHGVYSVFPMILTLIFVISLHTTDAQLFDDYSSKTTGNTSAHAWTTCELYDKIHIFHHSLPHESLREEECQQESTFENQKLKAKPSSWQSTRSTMILHNLTRDLVFLQPLNDNVLLNTSFILLSVILAAVIMSSRWRYSLRQMNINRTSKEDAEDFWRLKDDCRQDQWNLQDKNARLITSAFLQYLPESAWTLTMFILLFLSSTAQSTGECHTHSPLFLLSSNSRTNSLRHSPLPRKSALRISNENEENTPRIQPILLPTPSHTPSIIRRIDCWKTDESSTSWNISFVYEITREAKKFISNMANAQATAELNNKELRSSFGVPVRTRHRSRSLHFSKVILKRIRGPSDDACPPYFTTISANISSSTTDVTHAVEDVNFNIHVYQNRCITASASSTKKNQENEDHHHSTDSSTMLTDS